VTTPWNSAAGIDIDGDYGQHVIGATVHGDVVQVQVSYVRTRPSMFLSAAEVAARMDCYVPARNHKDIVRELTANRMVVIAGPNGSGRETTAIAAIRQLRPDIAFRRFSLDDEDVEEIWSQGPCGYLVQARSQGLDRLSRCAEIVRSRDSYLAVIAEQPLWPDTGLIAVAHLEHPAPDLVYRSWVVALGADEWANWAQAESVLADALPADARRLAALAARAAQKDGELAELQAEALKAYQGWDDELHAWFTGHRAPHERALLAAAATVPTAGEAYVYDAAAALARQLEIDVNGRGLAWCPVADLRALLGAKPADGPDVVFGRTGYAASVLPHTLSDYPLARRDIIAWLAGLPAGVAAPYGVGDRVAEVFADLAAEHGTAADITLAARGWSEAGEADLAFIALSRTCLHPRAGGQVRRTLYKWSREARTGQTLKLVIARVCEPLGQSYPLIALTRLKYLATHGNGQVRGEVLVTVRALLAQHRAEVQDAVLEWCAPAPGGRLSNAGRRRRRAVGAQMFLELAGQTTPVGWPELLDGAHVLDGGSCVIGWKAVLDLRGQPVPTPDIERALRLWLDAALRGAVIGARIGGVVVAAARSMDERGGYWPGAAQHGQTSADFVIGVVERWSALSLADPARWAVEESIVIPLERHWWRRIIKLARIRLRSRRR
jgi:hypothetical protein